MSGLSQTLKASTHALHAEVERSGLMRALLAGRLPLGLYTRLLRNLHAIYAMMESALANHAANPVIAPLWLPGLPRRAALEEDLATLQGADWRQALPIEPAASDYVDRLRSIAVDDPLRLAAHAYVRYLGDLNGGQLVARIVAKHYEMQAGAGGVRFYDFGSREVATTLRNRFRAGLDAIDLRPDDTERVVEEARLAFLLHGRLFGELQRDALEQEPALR
ncbi:MAG TPA: biliverdin-producing heme oxygenase [Burkholderiaceae bacterium]|nr:biliverdin-producing heme oxygenase [Burkholderiaceae bacterium]